MSMHNAAQEECQKEKQKKRKECAVAREEVETRKIGRNETRTFQALFPGCTQVNKKPGKEPGVIVSFLMNSNSN